MKLTIAGLRYLPVMISRIMLSLRKAADSQQNGWTLGASSMIGTSQPSMRFFNSRTGPNWKGEEIPLDTRMESQMETR